MSNLLQPAHHPDADQLSAFAEHALPLHEQQQTLAHLATCPDCRAVVFLAQQAIPAETPQPVPAHRPWFSTWNLAWAATAAFACALLVTIGLHNAAVPKPTPAVTATASVEPPAPPVPALSDAVPLKPVPMAKKSQPPAVAGDSSVHGPEIRILPMDSRSRASVNQRFVQSVPAGNAPVRAPAGGSLSDESVDQLSANAANASTPPQAALGYLAGQHSQTQAVTQAQTHTGPAQVQSQQPYQLAAAPPPPLAAPAAATAAGARPVGVNLGNASVAPAGNAASSAIHIAALASATPQTLPANVRAIQSQLVLPSHLLAVSTVSRAAKTLAIDTAGTLYLSNDSGQTWQAIPAQWTGHATKLSLPAPLQGSLSPKKKSAEADKANSNSPSAFELTTASGIVWTSPDGEHWKPK
jgi:hypothetical protein